MAYAVTATLGIAFSLGSAASTAAASSPLIRSSWRSMTITRGCSLAAIAIASAPSEQVITLCPAALSRYAIKSLLALLSSTTRIKLSLPVTMVLWHDEAEDASLSDLGRELDGSSEETGQALTDVQAQPGAFSRGGAVLLELLESVEQPGFILALDPNAGVHYVEPHRGVSVRRSFVLLEAHPT